MSTPPVILGHAAQSAYEKALSEVTALPTHLFRPQDWARMCMVQANELLGSHEGKEKLAEMRRYMACDELINRLLVRVRELEQQLESARSTILKP